MFSLTVLFLSLFTLHFKTNKTDLAQFGQQCLLSLKGLFDACRLIKRLKLCFWHRIAVQCSVELIFRMKSLCGYVFHPSFIWKLKVSPSQCFKAFTIMGKCTFIFSVWCIREFQTHSLPIFCCLSLSGFRIKTELHSRTVLDSRGRDYPPWSF